MIYEEAHAYVTRSGSHDSFRGSDDTRSPPYSPSPVSRGASAGCEGSLESDSKDSDTDCKAPPAYLLSSGNGFQAPVLLPSVPRISPAFSSDFLETLNAPQIDLNAVSKQPPTQSRSSSASHLEETAQGNSMFIDWNAVPERFHSAHHAEPIACSSQQESPATGSSVDHIIDHYGRHSSSTAQSQGAMHSSEPIMDRFIGQSDADAVQAGATASALPEIYAAHLYGPQQQISQLQVSSGFEIAPMAKTSPAIGMAYSSDLPLRNWSPSEVSMHAAGGFQRYPNNTVHFGGSLGGGINHPSDVPLSVESRVGELRPPPTQMHSVLGARGLSTFPMQGDNSSGSLMTNADEDPFAYDVALLKPSMAREVSSGVDKVRGIMREQTATVYSEDGTPSKTFYGDQYFPRADSSPQDCQPQPFNQNHFGVTSTSPRRVGGNQQKKAMAASRFYDGESMKSDWNMGNNKDINACGNSPVRFARASQSPGKGKGRATQETLNLVRNAEANRVTGNTED